MRTSEFSQSKDTWEEPDMVRAIGILMVIAGIPLTLLFCFPGLGCMGVGALLMIAGKK